MKKEEKDLVEKTNEEEYKKTTKPEKKSDARILESGYTNCKESYFAVRGELTPDQQELIKDGDWKKYDKLIDGSIVIH